MIKTNLDKLIEQEVKNDPSLDSRLKRISQAINIAIQIYSLRKQKNLTQAQLAANAHVRQSNISRLENADYEGYSKKTLEKIAKALDVDLAIFFIQKEKINNINMLLEIINLNQSDYTTYPGLKSNWLTSFTSVFNGLLIEKKGEENDEIVEVKEHGGSLKVMDHSFNFI